jgi:hypothetical protein
MFCRRYMPRMPRIDAAAACARLADLQRGGPLQGPRRVRSLRHNSRHADTQGHGMRIGVY